VLRLEAGEVTPMDYSIINIGTAVGAHKNKLYDLVTLRKKLIFAIADLHNFQHNSSCKHF